MKAVDARHFLLSVELLRDLIDDPRRYPFSLPVFRTLDRLEFHPSVTFLVGENGTGKSTLLEALAVECGLNPEGGSKSFAFATRESHPELHGALRLARSTQRPRDSYFLRAESYFNVATEIERLDEEPAGGPPIIEAYGGRSLHEQSHGESFFALFEHRLRPAGLYFLDEPEAALSPTRQLAFLCRLHALVQAGAQFIIATHSPIVMAYPDAWIYDLSADPAAIARVPFDQTEHYTVMRAFLTDPDRMLSELLG